jgi:hypothetical protein
VILVVVSTSDDHTVAVGGVLLGDVRGSRDRFVPPAGAGRPYRVTPTCAGRYANARVKEPAGAGGVRCSDMKTSMTCPNWSTARITDRQVRHVAAAQAALVSSRSSW